MNLIKTKPSILIFNPDSRQYKQLFLLFFALLSISCQTFVTPSASKWNGNCYLYSNDLCTHSPALGAKRNKGRRKATTGKITAQIALWYRISLVQYSVKCDSNDDNSTIKLQPQVMSVTFSVGNVNNLFALPSNTQIVKAYTPPRPDRFNRFPFRFFPLISFHRKVQIFARYQMIYDLLLHVCIDLFIPTTV